MIGCCIITVAFETSDALVSAYGIAVTGAFIFTTLLLGFVLHLVWHCRWPATLVIIMPMLLIDLLFWPRTRGLRAVFALRTANLLKIFESGWAPRARFQHLRP